jgi:hypothetical protein
MLTPSCLLFSSRDMSSNLAVLSIDFSPSASPVLAQVLPASVCVHVRPLPFPTQLPWSEGHDDHDAAAV